jgi:hypothetical protein
VLTTSGNTDQPVYYLGLAKRNGATETGDVRFEERDDPAHHPPGRRDHPRFRYLRVRLGPVGLPRHQRG